MARQNSIRKPATERAPTIKGTANGTASTGWVWVALLVGLAMGGATGYFVAEASSGEGVIIDGFGRRPGHPHYMHNHP
jgi:hypothetical protein